MRATRPREAMRLQRQGHFSIGQLLKFGDEEIEKPRTAGNNRAAREYGMNDAAARQPLWQDFHKQVMPQVILDQQGRQLSHRDAVNGGGTHGHQVVGDQTRAVVHRRRSAIQPRRRHTCSRPAAPSRQWAARLDQQVPTHRESGRAMQARHQPLGTVAQRPHRKPTVIERRKTHAKRNVEAFANEST